MKFMLEGRSILGTIVSPLFLGVVSVLILSTGCRFDYELTRSATEQATLTSDVFKLPSVEGSETNTSPLSETSESSETPPEVEEPAQSSMTIHISTTCSNSRSSQPTAVFYEEVNPIQLNLVTTTKEVVWSKSFSPMNLREQRDMAISYNLDQLKEKYPSNWATKYIYVVLCKDSDGDSQCTDESGYNLLSYFNTQFTAGSVPSTLTVKAYAFRGKSTSTDDGECDEQRSPLVLDLKHDGIALTGLDAGRLFDLDASGKKVLTGWVAPQTSESLPDDVFLVRDLNGNGLIDSGAELFGDSTVLRNGKKAINGFEALKDLDRNGDRLFDARDNSLLGESPVMIWWDRNSNAITDAGELLSLDDPQVAIKSIRLDYVAFPQTDNFGNTTMQRSTFTRYEYGKEVPGLIIDVWFITQALLE